MDPEPQVGHGDRMGGGAGPAARVGHVAAVVGAVEVVPVPAVREVDPLHEMRRSRAIGGFRLLRCVLTPADASPPHHAGVTVGHHPQPEGEGLDRGRVPARDQVVGEDAGGPDYRATVCHRAVRQRGDPVGRLVARPVAQRRPGPQRLEGRRGAGGLVAEEVVGVRGARLVRVDDGVVRGAVAVPAGADEVAAAGRPFRALRRGHALRGGHALRSGGCRCRHEQGTEPRYGQHERDDDGGETCGPAFRSGPAHRFLL